MDMSGLLSTLPERGARVGVDLVLVTDVAESIEAFGERYLGRVYTQHELTSCPGTPPVRAAGLAARFAGKEAVLKVLRPADVRPPWTSIEIIRSPEGWCEVGLSGHAAELAHTAGIRGIAVSLTHEGDYAAAAAIAWTGDHGPMAGSTVDALGTGSEGEE